MEEDKVTNPVKLVIIGGSAGSLEVVLKVLALITDKPSFALVIVMHRKSGEDSLLEELLAIKTKIKVQAVEDKTEMKPATIYIAPSDYHLLFEKNSTLSLDTSEKVNYSRPSIDVSFESAADVYGSDLVGILLSGANSDGTEGLAAIKAAGGTTIVQDPETAETPYMPKYAIQHLQPDYILDAKGIAAFLNLIDKNSPDKAA